MQKDLVQLLKISLKSSFILALLFLVGCGNSAVDSAIEQADALDAQFGINDSDYAQGFFYFETNVRDQVVNPSDVDSMIVEYEKLFIAQDDAEAQNYLQMRMEFLMMEKHYKLGSRRTFASFDGVIRCSKSDEILESVADGRAVIGHAETALALYDDSWKIFGDDFRDAYARDIVALSDMIDDREGIIADKCNAQGNETVQ